MFRTAFLALSLAMLGGGALAAKSAIDMQYSSYDTSYASHDRDVHRVAAR